MRPAIRYSPYLGRPLLDLHPGPLVDAAPPRPPAPAGPAGAGGGGGGGGHEGGGHVVGGAAQPLGQVGRRDGVGNLFQHISAAPRRTSRVNGQQTVK